MRSFLRFIILATLAAARAATVSAQSSPAPTPAPWVVADTAARTATITLEATAGTPSATLNGYREGGVQVVVPLRWTVTWDWRSTDTAGKHSLVVMAEREKLPTEGGRPAFTNGMSRSLLPGLAAGQADRTTFEADQPGWYWLLCGVPGHALAGEWIGLKVDAEASTAGIKVKAASP